MISKIFYTIFILYTFLFAYPVSVYSKEKDFLIFSSINENKFKKFDISDAFLIHAGYNFSIFTDNFQVVPTSFIDESNYAAMLKELDFNVGYNYSPLLGIADVFKKKSMIDYNRKYIKWLSLERKFEHKYYGDSLIILGVTPPFKRFSLYEDLEIQPVGIGSKDVIAENITTLYFSKEVGIAFKPKPWFSLFLGYNTETADTKIINTIFSGKFGGNMIEGLNLGFSLDV